MFNVSRFMFHVWLNLINIHYSLFIVTYEDLLSYTEHPEKLTEKQIPELKELTEKYPYFGIGHWLYLKALKNTNNIFFNAELNKTALFCQNKRNHYFFIHPDEIQTKNSKERAFKDGSYFDMIENFEKEGENNRQSLRLLAERLKAARKSYQAASKQEILPPDINKKSLNEEETDVQFVHESFDSLEEMAKKYVQNKNYAQALKILEYLNLNNPKKSIYFADQIQFLEKVLQKDIK